MSGGVIESGVIEREGEVEFTSVVSSFADVSSMSALYMPWGGKYPIPRGIE